MLDFVLLVVIVCQTVVLVCLLAVRPGPPETLGTIHIFEDDIDGSYLFYESDVPIHELAKRKNVNVRVSLEHVEDRRGSSSRKKLGVL